MKNILIISLLEVCASHESSAMCARVQKQTKVLARMLSTKVLPKKMSILEKVGFGSTAIASVATIGYFALDAKEVYDTKRFLKKRALSDEERCTERG